MRKKIIALFLCLVTLIASIGSLSGCQKQKGGITRGETLGMILEAFGMNGVSSELSSSETGKNQYVQIAYDWGLISDKNMDMNAQTTKGFLAETLVKCVGFVDTSEMSSDDIADYAAKNNYISFEYRGRTDSKREVNKDDVVKSIEKAYEIWSNPNFTMKEDITLGKDVINLVSENISPKDIVVNEGKNEVILPKSAADLLEPGKTFVVPPSSNSVSAQAFCADKIEVKGDTIVISTKEADIETTIENLDAQGSIVPDLANSPIIDGLGNVVKSNSGYNMKAMSLNGLSALSDYGYGVYGTKAENMSNGGFQFEIDGLTVKGNLGVGNASFSVSGKLANSDDGSITVEESVSIEDIKLDYDCNISWFRLKSAYAKLSYTTVNKSKFTAKYKAEGLFAPEHTNGNGHFKSNFFRAVLKDHEAKGAKSIKICSIPIAGAGVVRINLDVHLKLNVNGTVELIVTTNNVKGVEYKDGNIRWIKEESQEKQLNANCKIEATMYLGVSFWALNINIIGFGIEGGIGLSVEVTAYLVDSDNNLLEKDSFTDINADMIEQEFSGVDELIIEDELLGTITTRCDICTERTVYWILKFVVDESSVVGKLVGAPEIVFFDAKNAKINELCGHWENGQKVPQCTRNYEGKEKEISEENNHILGYDVALDIDVYFANVNIGDSFKINITNLPEGYSASDVVFSSTDSRIATVSSDGTVKGIVGGVTEIKVQTKDGKYLISCSVYVADKGIDFTPIKTVDDIDL